MKPTLVLATALFGLDVSCPAQAQNPFVNPPSAQAAKGLSGESFVTVLEHIVVPAKQLDTWLAEHPLKEDAAELRSVAQKWIEEKSATLDHTAVSTGTLGRDLKNQSGWEQIYPTEYEPPDAGEWPSPSAFATRNLGYQLDGSGIAEAGNSLLLAKIEYYGDLLPHACWHELAKRTRQPGDVFMPRFRSVSIARKSLDAQGKVLPEDPFAAGGDVVNPEDPFASREPDPFAGCKPDRLVRFAPGRIHLAGRFDDTLPEPLESAKPDMNAQPAPLGPNRPIRLIFYRGVFLPTPGESKSITPAKLVSSVKLYRVKHRMFSDWLQTVDIKSVAETAWDRVGGWETGGDAVALESISGSSETGAVTSFGNTVELIYPTEWEPTPAEDAGDGKGKRQAFSSPSANETRNTGFSFESHIVPDPQGALLHFEIERVSHCGGSVFRRILRDGEWRPDISGPVFAINRWGSEIRITRGKWILVGSGAEMGIGGQVDPSSCLLAFVRME